MLGQTVEQDFKLLEAYGYTRTVEDDLAGAGCQRSPVYGFLGGMAGYASGAAMTDRMSVSYRSGWRMHAVRIVCSMAGSNMVVWLAGESDCRMRNGMMVDSPLGALYREKAKKTSPNVFSRVPEELRDKTLASYPVPKMPQKTQEGAEERENARGGARAKSAQSEMIEPLEREDDDGGDEEEEERDSWSESRGRNERVRVPPPSRHSEQIDYRRPAWKDEFNDREEREEREEREGGGERRRERERKGADSGRYFSEDERGRTPVTRF